MGHITIVLKPNLAESKRYYFCLRNNYYMFGSAQVIMYLSHYILYAERQYQYTYLLYSHFKWVYRSHVGLHFHLLPIFIVSEQLREIRLV